MPFRNKLLLSIAFVLLAAAGLYAGLQLGRQAGTTPPLAATQPGIPELRPDFSFKDIEGNLRHANEWNGKVLLINFWATWCPPCRKEIPGFIQLRKRYAAQGFEVVGIAIDTLDAVTDFADELEIEYPLLIGEEAGMALAQAFGNRLNVLPYSAVVDRQGRVATVKQGEFKRAEVEAAIKPLL